MAKEDLQNFLTNFIDKNEEESNKYLHNVFKEKFKNYINPDKEEEIEVVTEMNKDINVSGKCFDCDEELSGIVKSDQVLTKVKCPNCGIINRLKAPINMLQDDSDEMAKK